MKERKTLLVLGVVASALLTLTYILYMRWVVDFAVNWSEDVIKNSLHLLGVSVVLGVTCVLEGLIIREAWHFYRSKTEPEEDIDLDVADGRPGTERSRSLRARVKQRMQRQIRETWTLWLVFIGMPLVVNVLVMNSTSGGFVLSGQGGLTRYATVATMLRSPDPELQRQGIDESVGLTERQLGRYLARIIAKRGEDAAFASWAAATRADEEAAVPIRWLFLKGDLDQRRTAVISLARLGDRRGAELAFKSLKRGEEPVLECMVALGLTGHEPAESYLESFAGDSAQPELLRAAAFWAITHIEQDRFRKAYEEQKSPALTAQTMNVPERRGYKPMLEALEGDSQVLRCAAIQGLRYTGPIETAETLMKVFEETDHLDKCQSLAVEHYKSKRYEIVKFGLVRGQIIDSLAGIGNRSIAKWLEKQAEDRENADEVILKTRDLARQIRNIR